MIQSPKNSPLFGAIKAAAAAVGRSPARAHAPRPASPPEPFSLDDDGDASDEASDTSSTASGSSATSSIGSSGSTATPIESVMEDLKSQMIALSDTAFTVRRQMRGLCDRAQDAATEPIDWLEAPLKPKRTRLRAWLEARGLPAQPTLDAFFDACLDAATRIDFESRVVTFSKGDAIALFGGQQRLTIFDILSCLPDLFE